MQNSLDANASAITLERRRRGGVVELCVRDDGEGVRPGFDRDDALRHLASHIGHSQKLQLDPGERARRVVAGQYGVGLLGFWSIGRRLVLRTRINGGEVGVLSMFEDSPRAEIAVVAPDDNAPPTFTELVVSDVHEASMRALGGRRLSDYLSVELRGQLLRRNCQPGQPPPQEHNGASELQRVTIEIHDRLARGRAPKHFTVEPQRYLGKRLNLPEQLVVKGWPSAYVELYLAEGASDPSIQIACGGTRVADDIRELSVLGLDRSPWIGAELSGIIDFPAFRVPPGTRRGVSPDQAALSFTEAMSGLAALVEAELERLSQEQRAAMDRNIVRELKHALRGFRERLPQYDLPPIASANGSTTEESHLRAGAPTPPARHGIAPDGKHDEVVPAPATAASVRILPAFVRVAPGSSRPVRAVVRDVNGKTMHAERYEWRLPDGSKHGISLLHSAGDDQHSLTTLEGSDFFHGPSATVCATEDAIIGTETALMVVAEHEGETVAFVAAVRVAEETPDVYSRLGIPEPTMIAAPAARWRSRMRGYAWEVNQSHPDYQRVESEPKRRLRYLLSLLAKEIVIDSTGRADAAEPLEALIEVLAHAESNLK